MCHPRVEFRQTTMTIGILPRLHRKSPLKSRTTQKSSKSGKSGKSSKSSKSRKSRKSSKSSSKKSRASSNKHHARLRGRKSPPPIRRSKRGGGSTATCGNQVGQLSTGPVPADWGSTAPFPGSFVGSFHAPQGPVLSPQPNAALFGTVMTDPASVLPAYGPPLVSPP